MKFVEISQPYFKKQGFFYIMLPHGKMAERLNAPHSKCGKRFTVSGVQIPLFPPRGASALYFCPQNRAKSRQFIKQSPATSAGYTDNPAQNHAKSRQCMPILSHKQVQWRNSFKVHFQVQWCPQYDHVCGSHNGQA